MPDYRRRIYQHYLEAGDVAPAGEKAEEFRRRAPYLERLIRDHFPEDHETAILKILRELVSRDVRSIRELLGSMQGGKKTGEE